MNNNLMIPYIAFMCCVISFQNYSMYKETIDKIDETNARLDAIYLILNEEGQEDGE